MNRTIWIAGAAIAVAAALTAGYWIGARGRAAPDAAPAAGPSATETERKVMYYRNPMGLPDTSPVPKKDPMGMDYIPVFEGREPPGKAGTVKISLDKVQLLGVRTEPAAERELLRAVQAVGTIQANERLELVEQVELNKKEMDVFAQRIHSKKGWLEEHALDLSKRTLDLLFDFYIPPRRSKRLKL